MKLFKVSVEVEFYMMAEDSLSARWKADDFAEEALRDGGGIMAHVSEVKDFTSISPEWMESLPYGGDGKRTIKEILEADKVEK